QGSVTTGVMPHTVGILALLWTLNKGMNLNSQQVIVLEGTSHRTIETSLQLQNYKEVDIMTEKKVENMKPNESPYLEKPKDFDPARRNQNKKYGGGGKSGSKK